MLFVIEYLRHILYVRIENICTYNYCRYEGSRLSSNYRPDDFNQAIAIRKIISEWFPQYSGDNFCKSILYIYSIYQASYAASSSLRDFKDKIRVMYINEEIKNISKYFQGDMRRSVRCIVSRKWNYFCFIEYNGKSTKNNKRIH